MTDYEAPVVDRVMREIADLVGKDAMAIHLGVEKRSIDRWISGTRMAHARIYAELAVLLDQHAARCTALAEQLHEAGQ
jgi:hypothetical protein